MTEPEIVNPIDVDDAVAWSAVSTIALLHPVVGDYAERREQRLRRAWRPERAWGARSEGRWVGNLMTEPRVVTIPAGYPGTRDVTADAVTAVGVAATHRRRGLLRRMIAGSLAAAVERGDALSILWSAEWPIYGRHGYAPASSTSDYVLRTRRPHPLLGPPVGVLRHAGVDELRTVAPVVWDAARRRHVGEIDRPDPWWPRSLGLDGYRASQPDAVYVVREGPDGPDGLLSWKVTRDFAERDMLGAAQVLDLAAASDAAYRDLWAYACAIDGVDEVSFEHRPVDEPIRWAMHDARALHTQAAGDALWVRLLDVPAALSARGYATRDRLVLDVRDDATGGYGTGTIALDADGAQAECVRSDVEADLRLDQRALAACYLGGHRLRTVAMGLPIEEITPGAIDRFDALFATSSSPWTSTGF